MCARAKYKNGDKKIPLRVMQLSAAQMGVNLLLGEKTCLLAVRKLWYEKLFDNFSRVQNVSKVIISRLLRGVENGS